MSRALIVAATLLIPVSFADGLDLQGSVMQGGMVVGRVPLGSAVSLDGEALRVSPDGVFVIGFDRDAGQAARIDVVSPDGSVEHHTLNVEQRTYPTQHINGLPSSKVTPGPEALKRIQQEQALINQARTVNGASADFTASFSRPVNGPVSGVFGSQRILNGKPRRPHYGVDFASPAGTSVKAPAPGTVTLIHDDMYFSGGTIILDHGHGISSVFIHLSRIDVKLDQRVGQGDVIGAVGATGRATGPHLHWGVNWFEKRLDPQLLIK